MNKRIMFLLSMILLILACNVPSTSPTPPSDLLATLGASTPFAGDPALWTPTTAIDFTTPVSTLVVPTSSRTDPPTGKIAFTCQVYKVQASNQICIMNADGSGFR